VLNGWSLESYRMLGESWEKYLAMGFFNMLSSVGGESTVSAV